MLKRLNVITCKNDIIHILRVELILEKIRITNLYVCTSEI